MASWIQRAGVQGVDITDELVSTGLDETQVNRVATLYEECASSLHSHQRRANVLNRMSVFFGLPIAIFAAVSGTAAFATLGQAVGASWRLLVIILSLSITVLSTVQTFFRFSEQAAKEQEAANQYSALLWEIRRWANTTQSRDRDYVDSFLSDVISEMQDTETQYRGGVPQRRAAERSPLSTDTTPPVVDSVSPLPNATGVSPYTNVTAAFTKDMDAATFNNNTFKVVERLKATPVLGTLVYDSPTRSVTFHPESPLASDTSYLVIISAGVSDQKGNRMGVEDSWEFTIGTQKGVF